MLDPLVLRAAAERAAVGVGYPHEIVTIQRSADGHGWIISFNDVSAPEQRGVFEAVIDDDATPDEAVERMIQAMNDHERQP